MAQSGGIDASARTTSRTDRSTRTPHLRCKSDMRDGRVSVPREFRDSVCPKSAHKICSGDLCLSFRLLHGSDPRQAPKRPTSPRTGQPPPSQEMALECLTETPHPLEHGPTSAKGDYTPDESTTGSRGEPTFDHRNPRLLSDLGPLQLLKTVFFIPIIPIPVSPRPCTLARGVRTRFRSRTRFSPRTCSLCVPIPFVCAHPLPSAHTPLPSAHTFCAHQEWHCAEVCDHYTYTPMCARKVGLRRSPALPGGSLSGGSTSTSSSRIRSFPAPYPTHPKPIMGISCLPCVARQSP